MTNWKNLVGNPPMEDCNVCVRIGNDFEAFKFTRHSSFGWSLYKYPKEIDAFKVPKEAMYINLDEIK